MYKNIIIATILLFSTQAIAKKEALLVGIGDYGGDNDLMGIDLDIDKMKRLFKSFGFDNIKVLYNQESLEIADYLKNYAKNLNSNDTFALYYSGHGSFVTDKNGDEVDRKDEVLVLSDGVRNIPFIDDNLNSYLNRIRARKLIIFDSCHSGTANRGSSNSQIRIKSFPSKKLDAPLEKGIKIGKDIESGDYIVLSASKDKEESLATTNGSLFTNEIYKLLGTQNSLESVREEATYSIVSYVKRNQKKAHHPQFTYSNPQFKNISMAQYLKTNYSNHNQEPQDTLQNQLDRLVNLSSIDKIYLSNTKLEYNTGDFINFTLNTNNQQGYLTILFVEGEKTTVLYPNPRALSKLISGSYTFPRDFGNFKVRAFKNCNGCQKDKTSIYLMLTPEPLPNIQSRTNKGLLKFTKGSTIDMAISKDAELVFDEPAKTSSGIMIGRYEFFVY